MYIVHSGFDYRHWEQYITHKMDRIKVEIKCDTDNIPIVYVAPNELEHKPLKNSTSTAVIIQKCDSSSDILRSLDITVDEPQILDRYDYIKPQPTIAKRYDSIRNSDSGMENSSNSPEVVDATGILERYDYTNTVPSMNKTKYCEICKSFGVEREISSEVCEECSSKYLPSVVLNKLSSCRFCRQSFRTPSNEQRNIDGLCRSCSLKFLPKVLLQPLEASRSRGHFQCYDCKLVFDRLETLVQHMKTEHNAMTTTTGLQNATTRKLAGSKNANVALRQLNDESQKIKRHSCNQCGYATIFLTNLIRHYRKHNAIKPVRMKKFECKDCDKKFAEKRWLDHHERVHLDEDERRKLKSKYKCDVCEYSTLWENGLKLHMQIHAKKRFECNVCSKLFSRKNTLKIHERSHHGDKPFECDICHKRYGSKTSLAYHMETSHVDKALRSYKYTCYICKYNSMSLTYLRYHMRRHSGIRPFKCRFCPKRCTVNYQCKVHELTHTKQRRYFPCQSSKNLATQKTLRSHMETHLLKTQRVKKYECNECDSRFYKKKTLLNHHQSKHNSQQEDVRHVCQKCSKEFKTSRSLKFHMTIHRKYTFNCHYCIRHFSSADKRETHENAKHKIAKFGRKKFECYVCRTPVKNCWTLKHHMRRHFNDRPFKCSVCSKGFMLKSTLKRHHRSHWSEQDKEKLKKFKCQLCNYTTAKRETLSIHLERHIKGPFRCTICSKEFRTEGRLSFHERFHKGAYRNRYICYICNYVGANITGIRTHLTKHSNDRPFSCEICHKLFKQSNTLKWHQLTHLDKAELDKLKKLKCHLCDYATRISNNLKRHILTHTGGEKNESCTKCSMKFLDKTRLRTHMLTHLDDSQRIKKFKCNVCGFAFAQSGNLKRHIASKHNDAKPFACDKCPQKYSDPFLLKKHLQVHIKTPHFCTVCTRKFALKSELMEHMANHKSKRFSCKLCPSKFSMNYHLKRHISSVHSGPPLARFPCTKCTKTFMDKSARNRHLQTHDNGPRYRLYECYMCQYSANVVYKLKQHLTQH